VGRVGVDAVGEALDTVTVESVASGFNPPGGSGVSRHLARQLAASPALSIERAPGRRAVRKGKI
jgi:hypothetical protein